MDSIIQILRKNKGYVFHKDQRKLYHFGGSKTYLSKRCLPNSSVSNPPLRGAKAPPPAPALPASSGPKRVVSMERLKALAEPKRKKPWKAGVGVGEVVVWVEGLKVFVSFCFSWRKREIFGSFEVILKMLFEDVFVVVFLG